MERLLLDLSVNVTAMFRDPAFYMAFRQKVVPLLRTYPFIRIWHAGCSTGEEVYSMAILLEEEGLLRPRAHLRHRHQRGRRCSRRGRASFRSSGCRSTRRTTSGPAARGRSPSTTRRSTTARCSSPSLHAQRRVLAAQPRHRPVVQRVQRHPLPQRADLLRPRRCRTACTRCSTTVLVHFGILVPGSKESLRFSEYEASLRGAAPAPRSIYRKVR